MQLHISAVGRLRKGAERSLVEDYVKRFDRSGKPLGLGPLTLHEVEDKKGAGIAEEARLLAATIPDGALVVVLDERGKTLSSPDLADQIAKWRDAGQQDLSFVIGGADGLGPAWRMRANLMLSFGPMVWPHLLARVMLTEQLYRAASILSGAPYHRA